MGQFRSFVFEFPSGDSKIQFAAVSLRQNKLTWTEAPRSRWHPRGARVRLPATLLRA